MPKRGRSEDDDVEVGDDRAPASSTSNSTEKKETGVVYVFRNENDNVVAFAVYKCYNFTKSIGRHKRYRVLYQPNGELSNSITGNMFSLCQIFELYKHYCFSHSFWFSKSHTLGEGDNAINIARDVPWPDVPPASASWFFADTFADPGERVHW